MYVCMLHVQVPTGEILNRASDPLQLKLQHSRITRCGYWELDLIPLEKQPILITTVPYN